MLDKRSSIVFAFLAMISCSSEDTVAGLGDGVVGKVSDLRIAEGGGASLTLAFTEVTNGHGQPASYEIRRATGSLSWGSASVITQGECAAPLAGVSIGATRTCVVSGLSAGSIHQFQLIPFRGKLNQDAVFGELSNVTSTGSGQGQPQDTTVSTVTVTPASAFATVDGNARLTALARNAAGDVLPGKLIVWTSSNPSVAAAPDDGWVTALATGTTGLTASSQGKSGSATLIVLPVPPQPATPPAGEPTYQPGVGTLIWRDDFEGVASIVALLLSYVTINGHGQYFQLAHGGGLDGSTAVRYDWEPRGSCTDDSRLLERSLPAVREIYAQYSIRYTPGFAFDWLYSNYRPCAGNAKKLFFLYSGQGSRFDFISENHWLGMGGDFDHPLLAQNVGPEVPTDTWGDGRWHRVTMHVIQSSTPDTPDGLIEAWIDGVKRWNYPNWSSRSSGGWTSFRIGANINQGSPIYQSEWVDNVMIWRP